MLPGSISKQSRLYYLLLFTIVLTQTILNCNTINSFPGTALFKNQTSSDNFIIRWAFQSICKHFFDPNIIPCSWPTHPNGISLNPENVEEGDTIFVRNVDRFFKEIHPFIAYPYIMITHGDYRDTCQESYFHYLDDSKIIAWFSIHPFKCGHKKFHPLPLGIRQEPTYYKNRSSMNAFFKRLREQAKKTKLLTLNFDTDKNTEREKVLKLFIDSSWCFKQKERLPFEIYMKEMASYKFALCPRGWGPDTYRTWEALIVGTIPIVRRGDYGFLETSKNRDQMRKSSQLDELYQNLPVLIINDWDEITETFLEQKYCEISSQHYSLERLYSEYWVSKIIAVQDSYFTEKIFREGIYGQMVTPYN